MINVLSANTAYAELLNDVIKEYPQVYPITPDMNMTYEGVSRLVMLDRYSFKVLDKSKFKKFDFVVATIKQDPKFPARGYGYIQEINRKRNTARLLVDESFRGVLENPEEQETGIIEISLDVIEKPLEIYYEQVAKRVATGLAEPEKDPVKRAKVFQEFYQELVELNFIPAGRVLYGAGSGTQTTMFNCYVMPYVPDSREGISDHRKKVMEIMSRGGGVGTNGSTLRPRGALAKGVNGKSSGSVSWLDDIAKLTHLVEQGGSRR